MISFICGSKEVKLIKTEGRTGVTRVERILGSYCLMDCKEIQLVYSKGDQPGDFFGRNDAKAEAPVLWPPHAKS